MRLKSYADWANNEVVQFEPHVLVRGWAKSWNATLSAIRELGVYEHMSIIVARWEFLGGLYLGKADTNVVEAKAWARKFLHPIRREYAAVHNLSGKPKGQRSPSEFFAAFRNRPFHGYTPTAIHRETNGVVGWSIPSRPHLGRTARGSIRISSIDLQRDLVNAMSSFAAYLEQDMRSPEKGKKPRELWRRAFWMRFCPYTYDSAAWRSEGVARALFK